MTAIIGQVAGKTNAKGKVLLGILNEGNMDCIVKDGPNTHTVNPGNGFPLNPGMEIEFRFKEKSGKDEITRKGKAKVE